MAKADFKKIGSRSRRKGKRGQNEIAHILRQFYDCGDEYFQPRSDGQPGPPDLVMCYPKWPWHMIEIRRRNDFNKVDIHGWWPEVAEKAEKMEERPIICYRVNGDLTWYAVISVYDWINCPVYVHHDDFNGYVQVWTGNMQIVILPLDDLLLRIKKYETIKEARGHN